MTGPGTYRWAYDGDSCDVNAFMWLGYYWDYPDETHLTDEDKAIPEYRPLLGLRPRHHAPQR